MFKFKEVNTSPFFKLFWPYMAVVFLIYLCLWMASCGARKSQVGISKDTDVQKEQSASKGSVSSYTEKSGTETVKSQNDKTKEDVSTKTTETFNPDGTVNKRTTETTNKKYTDKSSKDKSRSYIIKINTDSIFNNTVYKTIVVTRYVKTKDTDANNNALYLAIFGAITVCAVLFFIYKLITRKKYIDARRNRS